MDKRYYSAESLDRGVREFEREYGMSTEDFYARYMAGEEMSIPRFNQYAWAAFHEDVLRLTDGAGVDQRSVVVRVGEAIA
jgi:hypothetical protein